MCFCEDTKSVVVRTKDVQQFVEEGEEIKICGQRRHCGFVLQVLRNNQTVDKQWSGGNELQSVCSNIKPDSRQKINSYIYIYIYLYIHINKLAINKPC